MTEAENTPRKGNSEQEGPEVGAHYACLRHSEEAHLTEAQSARQTL